MTIRKMSPRGSRFLASYSRSPGHSFSRFPEWTFFRSPFSKEHFQSNGVRRTLKSRANQSAPLNQNSGFSQVTFLNTKYSSIEFYEYFLSSKYILLSYISIMIKLNMILWLSSLKVYWSISGQVTRLELETRVDTDHRLWWSTSVGFSIMTR